ncbi:MAG: hypothetical protein BM555_07035 [Crocinitomix sp. MedPE-SWsnd]|nr:MAG: hypothetical protein BM555_07035 [Crocinitomix sp. MedPE-SWsnd]
MIFDTFSIQISMKKIHFTLVILCGLLSSCYFVDDIFDPSPAKEPSLQELSEKSIAEYLSTKEDQKYDPYGFGEIKITKPIDIAELEKLEKQRKDQGFSNPELDSSIAQKKRFVEQNNIERTINLDHFFTFTDTNERCVVYETTFTLNDTLGVKNVRAKIMQPIEENYTSILSYFFYEKAIFLAASYQESKVLSRNFYAFFKAELENRKDMTEKSAFLLHALKITRQVKIKGKFDQQDVMERQIGYYMRNDRPDITDYENVEFSDLYETIDENSNEISGYYFFHKFIGNFNEVNDTNVVLIEFNPFYEIGNIYQMDRPFGDYFKN